MVIYDASLGCRATEEFCFSLSGALGGSESSQSSTLSPRALFYILPSHIPQHLYVVLKISKVLIGDGDAATAPYCNPERIAVDGGQQKLIERTEDCYRRLGRYHQPLAWGAMSIAEGSDRVMTLYRQRTTMSDDVRISLIPEAARGTLR